MARVHVHIRPTEALHSSVHATPSGLTIDLLESNNALPTAYWWRCRVEGLMQDYELTLQHVLWRLERLHSRSEIVTRGENGNHRTTNGEMVRRVSRLAGALKRLGVKPGDRVATLSLHNYPHLEPFSAPAPNGASLHTLNLCPFSQHLGFSMN